MSDIRDFFKAFIEGRLESIFDDDDAYVPVGEIPKELLQAFRRHIKDKEMLDKEVELFLGQEKLRVERLVSEKFDDRIEAMKEERQALWDKISDAIGVPREENLSLNRETGVVSKKVSDKKQKPNLSVVQFPRDKDVH